MTEVADGVHVSGALGRAPTDTYKISATYLDGYKVGGLAIFLGQTEGLKIHLFFRHKVIHPRTV